VKRGYMEIKNRQGEILRIPNMAVTIALVVSADDRINHFAERNDIANELKKYGKQIRGSVVIKERRQENPIDSKEIHET